MLLKKIIHHYSLNEIKMLQQLKYPFIIFAILACGCSSIQEKDEGQKLDKSNKKLLPKTNVSTPLINKNGEDNKLFTEKNIVAKDCSDGDVLSSLSNTRFCLSSYLEGKVTTSNPIYAPLNRTGWEISIDSLNLPYKGDFSEYETTYLLDPIGRSTDGKCYWTALLTRDFNGVSKELLLISRGLNEEYTIELILAAEYDFAECQVEVCSVIEYSKADMTQIYKCYDEISQKVIPDTLTNVVIPIF